MPPILALCQPLFGPLEICSDELTSWAPAKKTSLTPTIHAEQMAKAGQEPSKVFPKLVERIKAAHNPTKALGIAVGTFGTRAGTELTAAVRQGVFSTDKITKAIKGGGETVGKANEATLTLSDRWMMFKNTLVVAVAPAAEAFVKLLNEGMALALKYLPPLIKWVGDTIPNHPNQRD